MVCFRAHHQRSASHSGVRGRTLVRQDRAGRGRQADDFKLKRNEAPLPGSNCHPERSLHSRSEAKRSRRTATMAAVT